MYNLDGGFLRYTDDMECCSSTYHVWKKIFEKLESEAYWDGVRDSKAFLSTRISEKGFNQRRLELKRQFSSEGVSAGAGAGKKSRLTQSRTGVAMASVVQAAPVLAHVANAGDAAPPSVAAVAAVAKAKAAAAKAAATAAAAAAAAGAGDAAVAKAAVAKAVAAAAAGAAEKRE
jgi:hypothetical protein